MIWILMIPFLIQGLLIFIDEFYFHHKRGLPTWEVWGHPLDTFTIALPIGIATFIPYSSTMLYIYIVLSIFSCIFVTKDEFVHARLCAAMEHWLHAMLFVLHPIVFFASALFWMTYEAKWILKIQLFMLLSFMIYQVLFWRSHARQQRDL